MVRGYCPDSQSEGILLQDKGGCLHATGDCVERVPTDKRTVHLWGFLQGVGYWDDDLGWTCEVTENFQGTRTRSDASDAWSWKERVCESALSRPLFIVQRGLL